MIPILFFLLLNHRGPYDSVSVAHNFVGEKGVHAFFILYLLHLDLFDQKPGFFHGNAMNTSRDIRFCAAKILQATRFRYTVDRNILFETFEVNLLDCFYD